MAQFLKTNRGWINVAHVIVVGRYIGNDGMVIVRHTTGYGESDHEDGRTFAYPKDCEVLGFAADDFGPLPKPLP